MIMDASDYYTSKYVIVLAWRLTKKLVCEASFHDDHVICKCIKRENPHLSPTRTV